ncbi:MAG: FtsX-like permease family protein [bacterium]|nr:FtsX-like permease family protein [bacterium]
MAVYVPFRQSPSRFISLVVRTSSDPRLPAAQVRDRIRMVDADQPLAPFTTLEEIVAASLSRRRLGLLPLALFSLVALIMAMAGVYGVADYFVAQRRQEIGLRMALGAQPGNALWMVVRRAMFMALAGVAVGTAGALALSTLLAGMIYGVATPHPIIFLLAPPALLAAVFLASYIPARRAARVDPSITLRAQ